MNANGSVDMRAPVLGQGSGPGAVKAQTLDEREAAAEAQARIAADFDEEMADQQRPDLSGRSTEQPAPFISDVAQMPIMLFVSDANTAVSAASQKILPVSQFGGGDIQMQTTNAEPEQTADDSPKMPAVNVLAGAVPEESIEAGHAPLSNDEDASSIETSQSVQMTVQDPTSGRILAVDDNMVAGAQQAQNVQRGAQAGIAHNQQHSIASTGTPDSALSTMAASGTIEGALGTQRGVRLIAHLWSCVVFPSWETRSPLHPSYLCPRKHKGSYPIRTRRLQIWQIRAGRLCRAVLRPPCLPLIWLATEP
ncbi:hypothetical protein JCM17843_28860 [Kordiimonadales bacterium JCM 17843]|nr:hypothetical protein JCM17843_28860 [Kordiimonadales bacterium JCM 17843]